MTRKGRSGWGVVLAVAVLVAGLARPAQAADADRGPDAKEVQALVDKAAAYLRKSQQDDGSFSARTPAGRWLVISVPAS